MGLAVDEDSRLSNNAYGVHNVMKQLRHLLLILILAFACPVDGACGALAEGPAPDFSLQTLAGDTVRLTEVRGKRATLIVFWASWSPRSAEALRDYQALYAAHGGDGLNVVAVNAQSQAWEESDVESVRAVLEQSGVTFPAVIDRDLSVLNAYGFSALPSTVLIDASGVVVESLAGYPTTLRTEFRATVLRALGKSSPEPARSSAVPPAYTPKGKAGVRLEMGRLLFEKGKRERGLALIEEAVVEDPGYQEAKHVLAAALRSMGRLEEAERLELRIASLAE